MSKQIKLTNLANGNSFTKSQEEADVIIGNPMLKNKFKVEAVASDPKELNTGPDKKQEVKKVTGAAAVNQADETNK